MNLHTNKELFKDAIQATAQDLKLREIYVEKDYWVTLALFEIFNSDLGKEVVFKGGSSLSKCYKVIERFSEDIDLVILKHKGDSDNQLKNRTRKVSKVVERIMPEIHVEGVTNKMGNIRKTAHEYPKGFDGSYGQVRKQVIVEATWLGHHEPYVNMEVSTLLADMMSEKKQGPLLREYGMEPFEIQVLGLSRTICEKIMSLVRFSRTETPIADLRNKIRHIYDLNRLLIVDECKSFLHSEDFNLVINRVGKDDVEGYKNNKDWLKEHPVKALIFDDIENTWKQMSNVYNTGFKDLVTGTLPGEKEIVGTLEEIRSVLKKVDWSIT